MHAHQTVEILHLHPLQGPTRNRHQTKIKSPVLPRRVFVSENKKATWTKTVFNEFTSMLKRFQWLQKKYFRVQIYLEIQFYKTSK